MFLPQSLSYSLASHVSLYQYRAALLCLICHSSSKQHAEPLAGLCRGLPTVPEEPTSTMTTPAQPVPSASKLLKRLKHLTGDQLFTLYQFLKTVLHVNINKVVSGQNDPGGG